MERQMFTMIKPEDLVRHEIIGLEVKVAESTNKDAVGLGGKIVDETRQTIKIKTAEGKEKILAKDQCIFTFCLPQGVCMRVDGSLLVSRPEDRIKKKYKKW